MALSDGAPAAASARLILGGARSGKSARAQAAAEATGARRLCIATAEALDAEMAERIARHRAERGPGWRCVEAPLAVPKALHAEAALPSDERAQAIVVDCLTLWLSNLMHNDIDVDAATDRLIHALAASAVPVWLVSNEVGLGLVPETPLGRAFRDAQGRLNQQLATVCGTVELVVAGLVMPIKSSAAL